MKRWSLLNGISQESAPVSMDLIEFVFFFLFKNCRQLSCEGEARITNQRTSRRRDEPTKRIMQRKGLRNMIEDEVSK